MPGVRVLLFGSRRLSFETRILSIPIIDISPARAGFFYVILFN